MDFLNDAVVSMATFISAYRPAALYFSCPIDARYHLYIFYLPFLRRQLIAQYELVIVLIFCFTKELYSYSILCSHGNEELIIVLATLHDSLLPFLKQGLQIILAAGETTSPLLSDVSVSLKILSSRLVDLGWKLLDNCYLSEELFEDNLPFPATMKMFPFSVEDPVIRADILVQTFKEIAAVPQGKNHRGTFLQNIERTYQIMHRIQSLKQSGKYIFSDKPCLFNNKISFICTIESSLFDIEVSYSVSPFLYLFFKWVWGFRS